VAPIPQKVIKDDQAIAHFKTEKSETEFHAVQAKDSDIEIKEVENKEIFDETFEISVKKDTEISETEKKHDGESDQKVFIVRINFMFYFFSINVCF
jgi:hypothetical protein